MSALKPILATLLASYIPTALSVTAVSIGAQSADGLAAISHKLSTSGSTFLSSEAIALSFHMQIATEDIGFASELYLVAKIGTLNYIRTNDNSWQVWEDNTPIIATKTLTLSASESLTVLDNNNLPAGEYLIYAGYKTRQGNINYTGDPTTFLVFAKDSHKLHPIKHPEILHDYLYQAAINMQNYIYPYIDRVFITATDAATPETSTATTANISGTTLQEAGVDEGDRIKTDGDLLFSLQACKNDLQQSCLHSYQLQDAPAQATGISALQLSHTSTTGNTYYANQRLGEIYLRRAQESSPRSLIWLNTENPWQIQPTVYENWITYDNKINIKFIEAANPAQMSLQQQFTLDGELLSSRLVDGVLYILSRYTSAYQQPYIYPIPEPLRLDSEKSILPMPPEVPQDAPVNAIKPPLDFFLPHYYDNNRAQHALVTAENCFIAPQSKEYDNQASISVLTAIPVNNPSALQSRCITGNIETFYASPKALYFATSRYPYTTSGTSLRYDGGNERITEIHKFSLQNTALDYRGSGQVIGHLGWEQDKKSFRFGEYQDTLRIASSEGNSWNIESRTRITVLKEDSANQRLETVGTLENLGKPGERLYAARFLGDRGYLVTFKQTDPLIVLDFSTPETPVVLGELEINGYSDYLQPIGQHYLLGVGKDAVTDANNNTWTQGVKIALFDVSSAANLREVNAIIIGKRGTDATVLHEHHGLALLADSANHYKLALPIQLHETVSNLDFELPNKNDSLFYNWTHTGLYVFDIDLTGDTQLTLAGTLIAESIDSVGIEGNRFSDLLNDRAVIQNDSVHYLHKNQIISSEIKQLQ